MNWAIDIKLCHVSYSPQPDFQGEHASDRVKAVDQN